MSSLLLRSSPRHAKCAYHPLWTAQEKRQRCCWACQALLDPGLLQRKKPCANPWPWTRDTLGLGLVTFKGYKLNVDESKRKKKTKNDEAKASPLLCSTPGPSVSHAGHATAFVGVNEDDASSTEADLDMSHDDYSLVGWRDHVADKVAHYLHSVTTARGRHGGGHVDTIDDLLGLVKSAYVRLVGFTPTDHVASGTGEYELLVPDSQEEEDDDAGEEFIVPHIAPVRPRPENIVLPSPASQCSSPDDTTSGRSYSTVDNDCNDAPSSEQAERTCWMDVEELLGDIDDDADLTDPHWKRSAGESDDHSTATGADQQDNLYERDQVAEPERPGTTSSSRLAASPYQV
ncbi:uncharacterized protein ACA1_073650 [Acanthamoeba castellanii str. Neff]|uniref:Uncharacterized protein n=1 Tax=Acanthamoeba castellanii (strain ATCC 30010 / Neff) TaxID=1257118 RepID=L8HEY1_ACACF|nr:uncharacterized protein ACA1_073650 [Acanthamoeba castellanii str. Neff]ELR23720.1 hypothetical protein ACA1_073650 [Acanthamoeba castellanii str. Neff]